MPVSELDWHLDLPFWSVDGEPFQVTPRQVAAEPRRFSAQYGRTVVGITAYRDAFSPRSAAALAADLRFPSLDVVERADRLTILDGVHRLLKAVMIGRDRIAVRVLPWNGWTPSLGEPRGDALAWKAATTRSYRDATTGGALSFPPGASTSGGASLTPGGLRPERSAGGDDRSRVLCGAQSRGCGEHRRPRSGIIGR
ncbi:hypothetical protein ACQPXM_39095 [Kribbella sp. CA-253562]|uniref:hypothetical protein n=1 Tax=Kribbella sp. CA-253562 TaxID=3239942 RepID=UPI003D949B55